jgi:hypothetical protein
MIATRKSLENDMVSMPAFQLEAERQGKCQGPLTLDLMVNAGLHIVCYAGLYVLRLELKILTGTDPGQIPERTDAYTFPA